MIANLTPRENHIADLVSEGLPNKVIAEKLGLSDSSVKVNIRNIMRRLNLNNRTQIALAVVKADQP